MNKKKSILLLLAASSLATGAVAAVIATNLNPIITYGEGHTHELNHYSASAPTDTEIGKNREYWICCGCHKVYADAEATVEITDSIDLAKKTTMTQIDAPEDGDLISTLVNDSSSKKLKGLDQTDWATYTNGKGCGTVNYYEVDGKKAMFLSGSLASNSEHKTAIDSSNSGYAEFRFEVGQATSVTFDYKYYDLDSSVYSTESHTLAQWYDGTTYTPVAMDLVNDNGWHTITVNNTSANLGTYFVVKIHHFEGEIFLSNMSINAYDYNTSTYAAALYNIQSGSAVAVTSGVTVENDALVYSPTTTYEHYEGVLPKVNYGLYGNVKFTLQGNANYGFSMAGSIWNESTGIHGSNVTIEVSINLLPSNQLFITSTWGDVVLTNIIGDANIANGTVGLPFYFSVSEGSTSMKVSLPTLTSSVLSSANAGQIKFVAGGAESGDPYVISDGAVAASGGVAYTPDKSYTSFEVTVPAVNFGTYGQATYQVYFQDANYGASLGSKVWNESSGIHGLNLMTTLNVAKVSDTELEVTLTDGTTTLTNTVTDTDVIAGSKGVTFFFSNSTTKAVYVLNPTLVTGHTHHYAATSAVIGGQVETACSICGLAGASRAYTADDLDYNKFTFGAQLMSGWSFATDESANITVVDNKLHYGRTTVNYASGKLILPHVNFDAYSKVEFDIETKAYYGINLASTAAWNTAEYRGGTVCNGKIEVIVNGTNSLTVNFYDVDVSTTEAKWTTSITDASTYTGVAGIPFYANIPEGSDYVNLSLPTLTAK